MKLQKTLLGLTIGSAILAMSLTTAQARELRLAHGMTVDNAQHIGLQAFADEVAKLSNGELTVTIYPNGQLGGERETAEQTVIWRQRIMIVLTNQNHSFILNT